MRARKDIDLNTLYVANFCNFFTPNSLDEDVLAKCHKLAVRCLWLVRDRGDAVLLYEDPGEQYLRYVESVLGFRPEVFYPSRLNDDQKLISSALSDRQLVGRMRDRLVSHRIDPLYQCRDTVRLTSWLRLPSRWCSTQQSVEEGVFDELNDKVQFMNNCRHLGLPVHWFSFNCSGMAEVQDRIKAVVAGGYHKLVLKAARSAGGLRNHLVTVEDRNGFASWELPSWDAPAILEPVIDTESHFSVFGEVLRSGEVKIGGVTLRHVENFESQGATLPQVGLSDDHVERAIHCVRKYVREVLVPKRVHTPFDVDGSITTRGEICFWETNVRRYATQVQEQVGVSLGCTVTRSNEAFPVPRGASLGEVCEWASMTEAKHPDTRVIITLPPKLDKQTMGVCICGWEHSKVQAAYDGLMLMSQAEAVND